MVDRASASTHLSLLRRLRDHPGDQSAWKEFVDRYSPKIYGWCCRWNLQEADALDVTQMVLVRLAAKMRTFVYDPSGSFRAWLRTLARHAWSDFLDDRHRGVRGSGDSQAIQALESVEARDDLAKRLEEVFDLELLELATDRVQQRVQPQTWQAFQLTALEGLSGAEAANRLGMNVATVFKAKSKVQKMLQEEIAELERLDSP